MGNYTEYAGERLDDLIVTDIAGIWADIGLLGNEADSEKWAAKFEHIAAEYLMSSRFALMRILRNRNTPQTDSSNVPEADQYCVTVGEELLTFRDISMEHALNLSPEEHMDYLKYLLEIAGPSPEENPDLHQHILSRAWLDKASADALTACYLPFSPEDSPRKRQAQLTRLEKENKRRYAAGFTREEALQLGHILGFSLQEMQWYLLRVFDVEDGLRMNRSSDVIEAYCFLTGASCSQAARLKERYAKETAHIKKQDDDSRARHWTQRAADGLLSCMDAWSRSPETMEEQFLSWLIRHASGLDIPSRTARRIYRNLAAYAYAGVLPDEEALLDELLHICDMDEESEEALEYLYSDGQISQEQCNLVAKQLYLENKLYTDSTEKDNTLMWSVITTRKDKALSVSYGAVNSSRTRIQSLLMGTEEVEKGDLLYLLWFTFNLAWSDTGATEQNLLFNRIFDLKDAADAFLDNALLPPFYPPHLLEQSMLLSIVYAGKTGTDPSLVYGSVLQSLKGTREREKGSKKHSPEEQIHIIQHYRNSPEMTLKQCSLLYGISEKTISRWQKELISQGLIPDSDKLP